MAHACICLYRDKADSECVAGGRRCGRVVLLGQLRTLTNRCSVVRRVVQLMRLRYNYQMVSPVCALVGRLKITIDRSGMTGKRGVGTLQNSSMQLNMETKSPVSLPAWFTFILASRLMVL